MKSGGFIAAVFVIAFLVFAAWIVGERTKDALTLPGFPAASFDPAGPKDGRLPVLAEQMPEFAGIAEWLNGDPVRQSDLRGKVVLIDFWTYSCINCIRTLPYVTSWHEKYKDKGFMVIGIHTPEFAFEKNPDNVRREIKRFGIGYPVPLDNDYRTWNNFNNHYWPAKYLFDARGRLRYAHFGEGEYDVTERHIQALLKEAGVEAEMAVTEMSAAVDFSKIGTPETYLGYGRMEYLGSPEEVLPDRTQTYSAAPDPKLNRLYFSGDWTVERERAVPAKPGAKIIYRYRASKANLVMGSIDGRSAAVRVMIDGRSAGELAVGEERLYELFDDGGTYGEHLLELIFEDVNVAVYAFTFG